MDVAVVLAGLCAVVLLVAGVGNRYRLPAPLLLLAVGAGLSFVPGLPELRLEAEIVLLGLLPPLLYATAIQTSAIDFKANIRPIGYLSVLLVVVTTVAVGLLTWWLLPIDLPLALALGAVVAPPDAVAATAVAKRIGLPRTVTSILEGESLVNDATAITCLRTALIAVAGVVTAADVAVDFAIAAVGGVVIGVVVALVFSKIRRLITQPTLDSGLSLLIPFAAYLPAEAVHASGVVAVVVAGLILGHRAPVVQTAESRITERTNWRTISFLLENAVFLLIGLQVRWIISDLMAAENAELGLGSVLLASLAVLAAVIVVRLVWVVAGFKLLSRGRSSYADSIVIGWAGMRGVVTLAAALLVPVELPGREIVVFVALVVTVGTLMLQGLTLGPLALKLGTGAPDQREDALQVAHLLQKIGTTAIETLDAAEGTDEVKQEVAERIRRRTNTMWEQLGRPTETPSQEYRRLRLATLGVERSELLRLRRHAKADQEVVADVLGMLDVEEAMLQRIADTLDVDEETPLVSPAHLPGCDHLQDAPVAVRPLGTVCTACEADGTRPVSLRLCLTCGEIGCCDSSVGRHATRHFQMTGHPVMRSFEPGEHWRWCYLDERLG